MSRFALSLAAFTIAVMSLGTTADAQSTSTMNCYKNSDGARQCDTTTDTPTERSTTRCVFAGPNHRCETGVSESKEPALEPSYENVRIGGKTITIMRGMPTRQEGPPEPTIENIRVRDKTVNVLRGLPR